MTRGHKRIISPINIESKSLRALGKYYRLPPFQYFKQINTIWFERLHGFGPDADACIFVSVCWTDTALRRADFLVTTVFVFVLFRDDMGIFGDKDEAFRFHPSLLEHRKFLDEKLGINDTPRPDDGGNTEENTDGDLVRHKLLSLVINSVASVCSAVVTNDMRVFLMVYEMMCNFPLATVAVLQIDDDVEGCHGHSIREEDGQRKTGYSCVMADDTQRGKTALILAGGGMRSAHGAGFLAALADMGLTHPDIVIGTSGNAGNALYFAAGQYSSLRRVWCDILPYSHFINPWRFWKLMDIDYLVDTLFKKQAPLDIHALRSSSIRWMIPITDPATGTTHYANTEDGYDVFELLRAAKSIPLLFGKSSMLGGKEYIDGEVGPTLEDHAHRALVEGATRLVIVENRSVPTTSMGFAKRLYAHLQPAGLRDAMLRDFSTTSTCIVGPAGVHAVCVFPSDLPARFASHDRASLTATFERGHADAMALASELRTLLS